MVIHLIVIGGNTRKDLLAFCFYCYGGAILYWLRHLMCTLPVWAWFAENIKLQSAWIWIWGTILEHLFKASTTMFIRSLLSVNVLPLRCFSSSALNILKTGDILRERRVFTNEDVLEYSKVTHDSNPLHFDSELARNAGFEGRLVHGMLVAALFPRIISSHFVSHEFFTISLVLGFFFRSLQLIIQLLEEEQVKEVIKCLILNIAKTRKKAPTLFCPCKNIVLGSEPSIHVNSTWVSWIPSHSRELRFFSCRRKMYLGTEMIWAVVNVCVFATNRMNG